ncbi:MAG TPA: lactate permease LctP family transporter, partial [Blastocatellia bacterium]|nr:lactate permease LctP family transporter [Blastocatellia bacterium]
MTWTQVYDPFGVWWVSTLAAAIPIFVLLGLVAIFRVRPHLAAACGAATALIVASTVFHMPWNLSLVSAVYGAGFGILKIAWIVVAAVFLYDVSVHTGQFEIMKESVAGITADRRLQALLVAFCFGAFIEGAAGFGAPVAIAGAFMIGLGFRPFQAAALNLIANTAPVAWGAIGTPVRTLAAVSGLPEADLSAMIGRILPLTAVLVPFWIVRSMVGWAETFEVLPAILVVGVSFALTQFLWSNRVDSSLVDIAAGVVSLIVAVIFLHFWKPKRIWRFEGEAAPEEHARAAAESPVEGGSPASSAAAGARAVHTPRPTSTGTRRPASQVAKAWMPFLILSVFVLLWGWPSIKDVINRYSTPAYSRGGWDMPILNKAVSRAAPVVSKPTPEAAKFDFNWLSATGTGCFFAAVLAGFLLGLSPGTIFKVFGRTLKRMWPAVLAISFMLALGYVTRYSGMDAVLGLAFTRTGVLYPFFGTFLGWLGVALTGSDT